MAGRVVGFAKIKKLVTGKWYEVSGSRKMIYWVVIRIYSHIASLILIVYSIHDCTCRRSSTGDILSDLENGC